MPNIKQHTSVDKDTHSNHSDTLLQQLLITHKKTTEEDAANTGTAGLPAQHLLGPYKHSRNQRPSAGSCGCEMLHACRGFGCAYPNPRGIFPLRHPTIAHPTLLVSALLLLLLRKPVLQTALHAARRARWRLQPGLSARSSEACCCSTAL